MVHTAAASNLGQMALKLPQEGIDFICVIRSTNRRKSSPIWGPNMLLTPMMMIKAIGLRDAETSHSQL